MWKDIPTMLRTFHKGEMYSCCMIRARAYPDNGNLETVNNPPIAGELLTYAGQNKFEDNKKHEEQGSNVSYTYV